MARLMLFGHHSRLPVPRPATGLRIAPCITGHLPAPLAGSGCALSGGATFVLSSIADGIGVFVPAKVAGTRWVKGDQRQPIVQTECFYLSIDSINSLNQHYRSLRAPLVPRGTLANRIMNLQQLEYIVAIDTHRSFAKAAAACFVTQPTLS